MRLNPRASTKVGKLFWALSSRVFAFFTFPPPPFVFLTSMGRKARAMGSVFKADLSHLHSFCPPSFWEATIQDASTREND